MQRKGGGEGGKEKEEGVRMCWEEEEEGGYSSAVECEGDTVSFPLLPSLLHMSPPQETGLAHWVLGTGDAGWKCFWLCPQHTCTHTLTQTGTHASYWVVAAAAAAEQDSRPKKGKTAPHSGDAAATRERGETKTRKKGGMDRNRYVLGGNPRTFTLIRGRRGERG